MVKILASSTTGAVSSMDIIIPVLLSASALIGATVGLRFRVFVLVPIALVIVLVSAAVLRMHGFGPGTGIVIIVACLALNQAAYLLIHIGLRSGVSELSFYDVADGDPAPGRDQAVDDDHGDQNSSPSGLLLPQKN